MCIIPVVKVSSYQWEGKNNINAMYRILAALFYSLLLLAQSSGNFDITCLERVGMLITSLIVFINYCIYGKGN